MRKKLGLPDRRNNHATCPGSRSFAQKKKVFQAPVVASPVPSKQVSGDRHGARRPNDSQCLALELLPSEGNTSPHKFDRALPQAGDPWPTRSVSIEATILLCLATRRP